MKRHNTEDDAREFAKRTSRKSGDPVYVLESPPQDRSIQGWAGRFMTTKDGSTRSWERSITCYVNGMEMTE